MEPLKFETACSWIEAVYPEGLTEEQAEQMNDAQLLFRRVVEQLKPMLDSAVTRPTEESLLDSVQVIPAEFESQWHQYKREGNHMEAKEFVVNVSLPAWRGALRNAGIRAPRESLAG